MKWDHMATRISINLACHVIGIPYGTPATMHYIHTMCRYQIYIYRICTSASSACCSTYSQSSLELWTVAPVFLAPTWIRARRQHYKGSRTLLAIVSLPGAKLQSNSQHTWPCQPSSCAHVRQLLLTNRCDETTFYSKLQRQHNMLFSNSAIYS